MSLTSEQIQQFTSHGYTFAPGFFNSKEVQAMQAEIERFKRDGLLRNVATEGDGKTHSTKAANLQLCPMYEKSPLFRAVPFCTKVIEAVSSLIGSPMILHLDQVFLKPGQHGMGTNWHQDNAYFKISDPLKGTAMWIAVHDATIANGTIHVIPDLFNENLEHGRDPMSDHHIRCWPDESKMQPVELKAGGVAFFCYGTPHCTLGNTTDRDRAGAAFHFLHVDCAGDTGKGTLIEEDRKYRPYLTGPKATGGEREYGVKVAGTWESEVEKAVGPAAGVV